MYEVYAYDKDGDVEILLESLSSYDAALTMAKVYVPLVKGEIIRRPEHISTIGDEGEPFDWLFILKPDGTKEVITN